MPSPPTDPPPAPPPLNLPPSRARRQLAARLALHSQRKAESELETTEHSDSDNDDDDAPLQFGQPLHHSPKVGASDYADEETKSVLATAHRQLDLDDFANSPAADADDAGLGEDVEVEMRVALG